MLEYPSFDYLVNFYRYIFAKKKMEFAVFFVITFILSLLPYIILLFEVISLRDNQQRSFYGDGSILTFCSGLLCAYLAILFDYKDETQKIHNLLISLILFIVYVGLCYMFIKCQLNFDRSWGFIAGIITLSGLVLAFTFFCSLYLTFQNKIPLVDIQNYADELRSKKIEKETQAATQSAGGIKI